MKTVIIKFGGSSLADPGKIRRAAAMVLAARRADRFPVAVVSAPADATDDLLKLASLTAGAELSPRETDALLAGGEQFSAALLALAIQAEGGKAVSLTGAQAGILTDSSFSRADIKKIDSRRLRREIAAGRIPVVAGFQGAAAGGDITTLGRGGSDLTAVAIARALKAALCEFRTDVKGIYTAHPGIVPEARKIDAISYHEVIKLAELGSEVRQLRAIKYAQRYAIPLHLRSSFHDEPGTMVTKGGGKAGVACLSLKKETASSLVAAIGHGLGAAHSEKARAAAASAGISTKLRRPTKDAIIMETGHTEAEGLLKALHAAFFR